MKKKEFEKLIEKYEERFDDRFVSNRMPFYDARFDKGKWFIIFYNTYRVSCSFRTKKELIEHLQNRLTCSTV